MPDWKLLTPQHQINSRARKGARWTSFLHGLSTGLRRTLPQRWKTCCRRLRWTRSRRRRTAAGLQLKATRQ